MTRRIWLDRFVKLAVAAVTALLGYPLAVMLIVPAFRHERLPWLQVGPVGSYRPGQPQPATLSYQRRDGWVIRRAQATVYVIAQANGQLKVLSNVCSHAGCAVQWEHDKKAFYCPCHEAYFDPDGNVTKGPPPRPLTAYPSKVENGVLYVQLKEA